MFVFIKIKDLSGGMNDELQVCSCNSLKLNNQYSIEHDWWFLTVKTPMSLRYIMMSSNYDPKWPLGILEMGYIPIILTGY